MFILYHVLATIVLILSLPVYLVKNRGRLKEGLGLNLPDLGDPGVGRLWVHALSVGELLSGIPLLEALRNRYSSREICLSVKTASGLEVAKGRVKDKVDYLLPMPLDLWWSVRRMIDNIKPTVFILVETDIWPGLISSLKEGGVKTILVNGRVSPRTGRAYEMWNFLFKRVLTLFELVLMQTELDGFRIVRGGISPEKVRVTGNIKFDQKWMPLTKREREDWLALLDLKNGLIWVAGSTHHPEEKIIFDVFGQLLKSFPDLSLIVCPREAHRFNEVYCLARDSGFKVIRKTELPVQDGKHNLFILNTVGELGRIYGLADVAFVGGSLTPFGGHNLLEPASFGIPVVFGPHTFNFHDMSRLMLDSGGGKRVNDETELLRAMEELLEQEDKRAEMGKCAKAFVEQNQGALDRVMKILEPHIGG